MNKNQLIIAWAFLLSFITLLVFSTALAETKTCKVDLDNDGKKEIITTEDKINKSIHFIEECIITIRSSGNKHKDSFSMPERLTRIEFISLNKDSHKQILARSNSGMHYTNIAIYGYKNGTLYKIFENGSGCGIETDFKSAPPKIKVGIAKLDEEGWSFADEPDWEAWVWDGNKFNKANK